MNEFTVTRTRFDSQRRDERVSVSPTLFIGLGGSGKEVLMRLRRLFYTNMRETGLPICDYLWIDTDPKVTDIKNQDYDRISAKLYLPATDVIDARVDPKTLEEYYRNQTNYGHIFEWLHPSLKNLGPYAIQNGAGMVRPCGRLAFWSHFSDIRGTLERKLNDISGAERIKRTQDESGFGFDVDSSKKNIFLIASIAGGTGAGMLLDTAFLLKDIDSSVVITGIFFLPSVFSKVISGQKKHNIYANGYAALMELDYFMSPQVGVTLMTKDVYGDIPFKWGGETEKIPAAPFHTIYLVGWKNRSNIQLEDYTVVFQMAAEAMHLEFCKSDFGAKKRSVKVNLADFLINETLFEAKNPTSETIFSQYYPNRYSSFGISLIKLDTDRRRNAASYHFAKSLVEHWGKSFDKTDGIRHHVELALKTCSRDPEQDSPRWQIGEKQKEKPWHHDHICMSFLYEETENVSKSILVTHQEKIVSDFKTTRSQIEDKFKHNTGAGAEDFLKKLGDLTKVVLAKVKEDWRTRIELGTEALGPNGQDIRLITRNANERLESMEAAFLKKFHELLAKPGDSDEKAGRKHATEFCERYLEELDKIEQKFVRLNTPPPECGIALPNFKISDELKKIVAYHAEAKVLRAPLFKKTAVSWYDQAKTAKLQQELDGFKNDLLLKGVEPTKEQLLAWYTGRYYNVICTEVQQIFGKLRAEITRSRSNLDSYMTGLQEIAKREEEFFDSFNRDYQEIRHHLINIPFDEAWYNDKVREALTGFYAEAHAMTPERFLDEETVEFFFLLLNIPEAQRAEIDRASLRFEGFKHIFETICRRSERTDIWNNLLDKLEAYSFWRMDKFLDNTNVESEFQKTSVDDRQRKLDDICRAADVWIAPSAVPCTPEEESYIGVPSTAQMITANQAIAKTTQFKIADSFTHERGNMVFYKESAAFPLFRLDELWECREHYYQMRNDLSSLYKRHLDYRLIPKLRDVAPPRDQQEAVDLFAAGLLFIESLILGNCVVDPKIPTIQIKMPWYEATEVTVLGSSFGQIFRNLSNSTKTRQLLAKQIDQQKIKLKNVGRNPEIEELKLAEYYVRKVFPPLSRAGFHGEDIFHTNLSLVCLGLKDRLINEIINRGDFTDREDEAFATAREQIDLEAISCVFPFHEEDAQAELRVLKVP